MAPPFVNIYGRKGTRGLRPWLLIPKVAAVGLLLGGMAAVSLLAWTPLPLTADQWNMLLGQLAALYRMALLPAASLVTLMGVLLLLQHPRQFLRMRWLQVKLVVLLATLPALHLALRALYGTLRQQVAQGDSTHAAASLHRLGFVSALAFAALLAIMVLGRLKPRLGQNPAGPSPVTFNAAQKGNP